jgi:KDO2-lipid IV(A) lauroyltransferase
LSAFFGRIEKFTGKTMSQSQSSLKTPLPFKAQILVCLIKTVGYLPLSAARRFGAALGWCSWLVQVRGAKVTRENIALCFPDLTAEQQLALAKSSVIETGKLAAEVCVIRQRDPQWLQARIKAIHGEALIKEEIAKGKGLILLAPHLGNWEVLGLTLPSYGKMTALYQPPKQAYLEELVKSSRQKTGAELVPTTRRGVVKLLTSLKSGGITAVLPDQNPAHGSGEFSPFFGHLAYTMTMVHGFVNRADCPLIMGFVLRVKDGFEVFFIQADEAIYSKDPAESLAAMNQAVEKCIAHCPEQYQWEYKRFKKIPPNGVKRYRF